MSTNHVTDSGEGKSLNNANLESCSNNDAVRAELASQAFDPSTARNLSANANRASEKGATSAIDELGNFNFSPKDYLRLYECETANPAVKDRHSAAAAQAELRNSVGDVSRSAASGASSSTVHYMTLPKEVSIPQKPVEAPPPPVECSPPVIETRTTSSIGCYTCTEYHYEPPKDVPQDHPESGVSGKDQGHSDRSTAALPDANTGKGNEARLEKKIETPEEVELHNLAKRAAQLISFQGDFNYGPKEQEIIDMFSKAAEKGPEAVKQLADAINKELSAAGKPLRIDANYSVDSKVEKQQVQLPDGHDNDLELKYWNSYAKVDLKLTNTSTGKEAATEHVRVRTEHQLDKLGDLDKPHRWNHWDDEAVRRRFSFDLTPESKTK